MKEYNNYGYLIFEGEYLNRKRNEKRKIYSEDKLIFEYEYLNGKVNWKAKLYDEDGNLMFDGVYLDGERWNDIE